MGFSVTAKYPQAVRLLDEVADPRIRRLFERYIEIVTQLHDDISMKVSSVEIRIFSGDIFLCRVVPYRELFHVQVGENPAWEIRVRGEGTFLDTVDKTLQRFLKIRSSSSRV